jgi:Tfp pilus assembly protein PilX
MKILIQHPLNIRSNRRESGMATLIFIILLTIMMMLTMAELRCVVQLHREVKLLEQQQIKRLNLAAAPAVNKPVSP